MSNFITRETALLKAAQKLDISPSKYKQAMERYHSMRTFLLEGDYEGSNHEPEVYLQGSFKLGTEIRPFKENKDADYDIDIVCRLEHKKEKVTAKTVKHLVGDHLKSHGTYERLLDGEGKRCWTLNYAEEDGVGFHMDILPSIQESWNSFKEYCWNNNAIAITNKNREDASYNWKASNPKEFAKWFYDKNKAAFDGAKLEQKQVLFESHRQDGLFVNREAVPNIHVKTPLQRAIQLLKRHRDIRFSKQQSEKYKPISIIITVLSARSYRNETTIYETLKNLVDTFSQHAAQLQPTFRFDETLSKSSYALITRKDDGTWYIPNPANHGENFADKWHENNHARAKAFFQWVAWARDDFINIAELLEEEHYDRSLISIEHKDEILPSKSKALTFNVAHREKPHWPVMLNHDAQISAKYKINGTWQHFRSSEPLRANYNLFFKATTKVLPPFQVFWQVVNTGEEAKAARQLRGQIYPSKTAGIGGLTQREYTAYVGDHWVECFIVKNGVCVARSGEFVVRIV